MTVMRADEICKLYSKDVDACRAIDIWLDYIKDIMTTHTSRLGGARAASFTSW